MTVTRITSGADNSYNPSINSDGTKIAFQSYADPLDQGNIILSHSEIWLYDTTTMTVTRITTGTNVLMYSSDPSINSDGTKIAFSSDADLLGQGNTALFRYEIWLYDTTTMTFTRITTGTSDHESISPSISSDGTKIAFLSNGDFLNQGIGNNPYEIWLYDTATMTLSRFTTATSDRSSYSPSINSDGTKIAFDSNVDFLNQGITSDQYEVWLYEAPGASLYLPSIIKE